MMGIATILDQKNHHNRLRREHICLYLALMTHHDHTKFDLPISCSIHDGMVQYLLTDSKSQKEGIASLCIFLTTLWILNVFVIFGASLPYEGSSIISLIGK